ILSAYSSPMRLKLTYWWGARVAIMVRDSERTEVGIGGGRARGRRDRARAVGVTGAARLERALRGAALVKGGDQVPQGMRLGGHLLGRRGQLFGRGGAPLGHLVDLAHRAVDLLHAGRLLVGPGGDLLDQLGGLADRRQQLAEQRPRALGDADAGGGQLADLLGGGLAPFGYFAHRGGDHREATPLVAGARR